MSSDVYVDFNEDKSNEAWATGRWKNLSPTKDDISDMLAEHIGGTWYVRVD
jgi:hypothetical protein